MVLDEYSRECLAIYVDRKINSQSVKRALAEVIEEPGAPTYARSDNGPEFVSKNLRLWLSKQDIRPQYIEPGSPWQNGFIESFNDTFRRECLNREQLWSRGEAQSVCNWWRELYNYFRPHSSINDQTPVEFAQGTDPRPAAGRAREKWLRPSGSGLCGSSFHIVSGFSPATPRLRLVLFSVLRFVAPAKLRVLFPRN